MNRWPAAFLICVMGSLSACSISSMMDMGDTPPAEKAAKKDEKVAALVKKLHEAPHSGPGLDIVG